MQVSKKGLDFIKGHEKFMPQAYIDPVGRLTIGYGHVIRSYEAHLREATLTEQEATNILINDLKAPLSTIKRLVKVDLNQNQIDALASLIMNIGSGAFQSSTVLRRINDNESEESIKEAWRWWNKGTVSGVKVTLPGLVKRRKEESQMYFGEITDSKKKIY